MGLESRKRTELERILEKSCAMITILFSNPYILQPGGLYISNFNCLAQHNSTALCCNDIGIRKLVFVYIAQLLSKKKKQGWVFNAFND